MKKTIFIMMALAALFVTSCEKELPVWEDQTARLNFYNERSADTLSSYCFVYHNEVPSDTIWMRVTTMGFPSSRDRQFELQQVATGENDAVAGTHYVAFDNAELRKHYVIKADSVGAYFPVVVLRHDSEADKIYTLKFTIKDNDEFKVGFHDFLYKYVTITDMLVKPANWGGLMNWMFGQYGTEKHKFMMKVSGELWDETYIQENNFHSSSLADQNYMFYLSNWFQLELDKENVEREARGEGPLCEANGTIVYFQIAN
ncbi:MAG: DUF4843 domain-containing protein [Prevotella sp.]